MQVEEFNKIVEDRKKRITETLLLKASEYSRDDDRLHNFKRAAAFSKTKPTTVAWGFNLKHLTSIADLIDDIEVGKTISITQADEKFGDAINYLILIEALIVEYLRTSTGPRLRKS